MCRKEDRMHVARIMANNGHSQKDIAAKLGVSDRMVRKYLKPEFGTRRRKRRTSILEPFFAFLDELLEEDPFINLVPVYERLQRRGYTGGMTILRDHAGKVRKRMTTRAVRRFETEPGLQAQVDWKECGRWNIGGELIKLYAFVMVLGYSRKPFVLFTTNMKLSTVLKAHLLAFAWYGAVPREILYDNMKTAWHYASGQWMVNPELLMLASACGFTPRRCRVRRPQTKGKDERGVGYVKRNAIDGRSFSSMEELRAHLRWWTREVADVRIHGTTGERPIDRFRNAEAAALKPLGSKPRFQKTRELRRVVHNNLCVEVDTNHYSVPWRLIGEEVLVLVSEDVLTVSYAGAIVARHPRLKGR